MEENILSDQSLKTRAGSRNQRSSCINDNECQGENRASSSHVEAELENFRQEWKKEIAKSNPKQEHHRPHKPRSRRTSEYKVAAERKSSATEEEDPRDENIDECDTSNDSSLYSDDSSNEDDGEITDFLSHIQNLLSKTGSWQLCYPAHNQKTTHISTVPPEIFLLILKWVVSKELDVHSLEQLSKVCRGFFVCCRDPEIWRLACVRIWGENCGFLNNYFSWREMFIYRPHLWYHGVYISKTTYIRYGEPSFQDTNYRPCYMVEYFRYLRFFSDGQVLMLTTSDDPYQTIGKLRNEACPHPEILKGRYHLVGSSIVAILKPPKSDGNQNSTLGNGLNSNSPWIRYQRQPMAIVNSEVKKKRFHMELEIKPTKRRPSCKLLWSHYAVHSINRSNQVNISPFDLKPSNYPPFWFSRVRSFAAESKMPLR